MKNLTTRQIINIVLIILTLIIVAQNLDSIRINFLFIKFNLPLIVIIAFAFFTGFFTAKVFWTRKPKNTGIAD